MTLLCRRKFVGNVPEKPSSVAEKLKLSERHKLKLGFILEWDQFTVILSSTRRKTFILGKQHRRTQRYNPGSLYVGYGRQFMSWTPWLLQLVHLLSTKSNFTVIVFHVLYWKFLIWYLCQYEYFNFTPYFLWENFIIQSSICLSSRLLVTCIFSCSSRRHCPHHDIWRPHSYLWYCSYVTEYHQLVANTNQLLPALSCYLNTT